MADGLTTQSSTLATIPTATKIATDDAGSPGHVQMVKLAISTDGSATALTADNTDGLLVKVTNPTSIGSSVYTRTAQTPTVSSGSVYASGDVVGGLLTYANVGASAGKPVRVVSVNIVDKGQQYADFDLVLFDVAPTVAADNAAFDPTDAELSNCVGIIPVGAGHYTALFDNSVAHVDCDVTCVLTADDLYGVLVARGTPTYTSTSDLVITVTTLQA